MGLYGGEEPKVFNFPQPPLSLNVETYIIPSSYFLKHIGCISGPFSLRYKLKLYITFNFNYLLFKIVICRCHKGEYTFKCYNELFHLHESQSWVPHFIFRSKRIAGKTT
jgi:hypothetical protein